VKVTVLSPDQLVLDVEDADFVFLPGEAGDLGVMPDHMPLLTGLRIGTILVRSGEVEQSLAIAGGFSEITPGAVKVIADAAEIADKIDQDRAREAQSRAEELLRLAQSKPGEVDVERAQLALQRAANRLTVAAVDEA